MSSMIGQKGFALLWSKILDSSVWMESKETRLVWITMLAMKDSEGKVVAAPKALAWRARVSPQECLDALKVFMSPDPESTSKVDEGRRIREIPGGWQIINHELYRFSTEAKREFWKEQKRKQREKQTGLKPQVYSSKIKADSDSRSRRFEKAERNGDVDECDRIAAEGL